MTTYSFIAKRLADDWKLLAAIFAGIVVAATLIAGAPVYLNTLERQSIDTAIDRADQTFLNIYAIAPYIALNGGMLDTADSVFAAAVSDNIDTAYRGHARYLRSPTYLVGTPHAPLPTAAQAGGEESGRVSRGYFQHIADLESHVDFLQGRMASGEVEWVGGQPKFEAVVGRQATRVFGVEVGDTVAFTPSLSDPTRALVEIVGVVEPSDPSEEYWQQNPSIFMEPAPLEELPDADVEVDPEEPPLAAFVTRRALVDGVGAAYPGTLVSSTWYVFVDREELKKWGKGETRERILRMESRIAETMPGSAAFTGIERLLDRFERRSFFTSAPLLLLLAITAITALYYILMMVSYLVASREPDVALLRSRGAGGWTLARIYALEGVVLTLAAAAAAPFIAMGGIALAGKLGYFAEITRGDFLPVAVRWTPFAASAAVGLLCLAMYVAPGVIGARTGLVERRLRVSRPPSMPFFQRYYVDVGLMVVGGLVFWELFARGQIISGGLFGARGVNEALLFAPALLLTVVALLFMRFFPLAVRFLGGESPELLHLFAAVSLSALALAVAAEGLTSADGFGWLWSVAHVALVGALYAGAWRARGRLWFAAGVALQAAFAALFVYRNPLVAGSLAYAPTIALAALAPAQLLFVALRRLSRIYPVWASMAIWRMARNPLQYSWLVLLIVMAAGLGVLATTVGGTLDRSYEERILYEVAADVRLTGAPTHFAPDVGSIKSRYAELPGVSSLSMALRGEGSVGATYSGSGFDVLAVESDEFPYVSWYREDFSERPLPQLMGLLRSGANLPPLRLPDDADRLSVWARPKDEFSNVYLWMALQDRRGVSETITFGPLEGTSWTLMESAVPRGLEAPIDLISVQIYEPAFGPAGTAGTLFLDDIRASARGGEGVVLDDFEGVSQWTPLSTSMISRDSIGSTRLDVKNGARSGAFVFGKDTDRGIRGFYRSPSGGPVPVVASVSFAQRTGTAVGDAIIVNIFGRLIPVRIVDTVEYFPTLNPSGNGFLLADLDTLLSHLNILSPTRRVKPNELLLSESPGAGDEAYLAALSLARSPNFVHDRDALLDEVRLDPLINAGWRAMMLVSFGVIALVAALGYATYLISYAGKSRMEMGFLQALGLRRSQMTRLLAAEHLAVAAIGLAVGTAAGFAMSGLLVSALAVTEDGLPVIPPFVLTTDWAFMAPIYAVLTAIFVGALLWLARSSARRDIHELTREEGDR